MSVDWKPQIICDTRQKENKHKEKHRQLIELGYEIVSYSMPVGDYQFFGKGDIVVDTKQDIIELFGNLGTEHKRFSAECERAFRNRVKLIILTEEIPPNGKILEWKSPTFKSNTEKHKKGQMKSRLSPAVARKIMLTMQDKYSVMFRFCDKSETGQKIIDYLGGKF